MAEIGTVLAIIQIADRVVGLCRYWIGAVRDAPSDLRSILLETSMLKTVLENVEFLTINNDNTSTALSALSQPEGPVQHCHKILTDLVNLLPGESVNVSVGVKARLAWPLRETKARKLLSELEHYKTAIALALTTDSAQDIKDIRAKTSHMSGILSDNQRDECCRWLERTDPSPLHNRARSQIEEGTCEWMLRSPEWTDWLAAKHRCLWVHGIPGAGKTVLASYLVEEIKNLTKSTSKTPVLYYYCYYGHNQDEAASLLRWISAQLCRKSRAVPDYTCELFKDGCEPSLPELLNALAASLEHFETVYLIVDAVDESMPRDQLLKVLRDITSDPRFSKIQLLATSREYLDIERVWKEISIPISMSNPFITEDIQKCVRAIISKNHKFKRWPEYLLDEVEKTLCNRARGMFRWVVCQLDRLQRMTWEPSIIRSALATLPKTLDETYERIFLEISEEERPLVRQCLKWIEFHNSLYNDNIPLNVLLRALGNGDYQSEEDMKIQYFDEESLKEICGCLVNISIGHAFPISSDEDYEDCRVVSFAHYTVREFLVSDRIGTSSAAYFMLENRLQLETLRTVLFTALNVEMPPFGNPNLEDAEVIDLLMNDFPTYCGVSAVFSVSLNSQIFVDQADMTTLVFELLDPSTSRLQGILEFISLCEDYFYLASDLISAGFDFWTLRWATQPNPTMANVMLLFSILTLCDNREGLTKLYLQKFQNTMELVHLPLQFTMSMFDPQTEEDVTHDFNGSILEFFAQDMGFLSHSLLSLILDHTTSLPNATALLHLCIGSYYDQGYLDDYEVCLKRLLELGADPNGHAHAITPLQIATENGDYYGVQKLLHAGADPNLIGIPDGIRYSYLLRDYDHLEGLSALYICQNGEEEELEEQGKKEHSMLESLLISHGARSFVLQSHKCELRYILNT